MARRPQETQKTVRRSEEYYRKWPRQDLTEAQKTLLEQAKRTISPMMIMTAYRLGEPIERKEEIPMSMTKQDAHDRLADAIYWFSGYAAATGDATDCDEVHKLAENLREVQRYIESSCLREDGKNDG